MLSQSKVLVLNRSWTPVRIVTLEKALKKLFSDYNDGTPKARIIDPNNGFQSYSWEEWSMLSPVEGEEVMKSVNAAFRVPRIILFTKYDKLPSQKIRYNRRTIYRRDGHTCQYCGKHKPGNELSLDHVIPKCQGGRTNWDNIVVACTVCNAKKAGRTPSEANMKLLSVPHRPKHEMFLEEDITHPSWKAFFVKQ